MAKAAAGVLRLVGVDPGGRMFFTAAADGDLGPSQRSIVRVSSKQHYHEAGITARNAWMQKQLRAAAREGWSLEAWQSNIPTSKTASFELMRRRAEYFFADGGKGLRAALDHYGSAAQLSLRWHVHIKTQRWMAQMVRMLVRLPGNNGHGRRLRKDQVVIGWGSGGSGAGGCISLRPGPVPCKRLARLLMRFALTYRVPEPMTSRICSRCCSDKQLEPCPMRGGSSEARNKWRYRVKACNSCHTLWNRDVNAARNILTLLCCILLCLPRPQHLGGGGRWFRPESGSSEEEEEDGPSSSASEESRRKRRKAAEGL
jgi:hypothetical protein